MNNDTSFSIFSKGFNCAQAVLVPQAKKYELTPEISFRIASAFGAGMGRMQETCGAVTGALMVIGLKYGFTVSDDSEKKKLVLDKTRLFISEFKNKYHSISCRELLQCDLNTEEGQKKHKNENQRELICMECIRHASNILEHIIA